MIRAHLSKMLYKVIVVFPSISLFNSRHYIRFFKQILYAKVNEKRSVRQSRARWLDYIEDYFLQTVWDFFQATCCIICGDEIRSVAATEREV